MQKDLLKRPPITFRRFAQQRESLLILIVVVACIALGFVNQGFWQPGNFKSMARGFTIEGVTLIGMTFLLVSGVFDISVGSIMAFAGFLFASLAVGGMAIGLAIVITIAVGAFIGLLNGLMITRFKVNPFIATLAMQTIVRGLVQAFSQGKPVRVATPEFTMFSTSEVLGIPTMFIIFVAVLIIVDLLLRKIRFFRQLYFIGGNETSAELTGIDVKKMRVIFYVVIAALAAISGMLSASRLESAVPNAYIGSEMKLMVACVIGGCSLNGGQGTMAGSALGLVFLFILDNALIMIGVDAYWFMTAIGAFLIIVVLINTWSAAANERRLRKSLKSISNWPQGQK
jgi:ribose transport system permease protein